MGCTNSSNKDISKANYEFLRKSDTLSGTELEKLIHIDVDKTDKKYIGQYDYFQKNENKKILSGEFKFTHYDSSGSKVPLLSNDGVPNGDSLQLDGPQVLKDSYTGQFIDDMKEGKFIKKYLFDDGVDWYENYEITIVFEKDQCTVAIFKGAIGTAMPQSTYKFENLETCSFKYVKDLAWKEWSKEFAKKK